MATTGATTARGNNVAQRLQKELMDMMLTSSPGISAFPSDSDITSWTATISGPPDSPYESLEFKLHLEFAPTYPMTPPNVVFKTPVYHPNIDMAGRICLDILKDKWSAVIGVRGVLLSLQSLLGEPNVSSPLNAEAAELYDKDREMYKKKVLARHKTPEELEEVGV